MKSYFGFIPSPDLNDKINESIHVVESKSDVAYYPYRDTIAHKVARELTDNLLTNLIAVIPNPERQKSMVKIVRTIEDTTDTMLNLLMGKDNNKEVLPTFEFMRSQMIFEDEKQQRYVGFRLTDADADYILDGFNRVTPNSVDIKAFQKSLGKFNHLILDHFLNNFAATLPLGVIKRKSVTVANAAINKGLSIALNKLLPQLDDSGINRLADFYRPYIIEVS